MKNQRREQQDHLQAEPVTGEVRLGAPGEDETAADKHHRKACQHDGLHLATQLCRCFAALKQAQQIQPREHHRPEQQRQAEQVHGEETRNAPRRLTDPQGEMRRR